MMNYNLNSNEEKCSHSISDCASKKKLSVVKDAHEKLKENLCKVSFLYLVI